MLIIDRKAKVIFIILYFFGEFLVIYEMICQVWKSEEKNESDVIFDFRYCRPRAPEARRSRYEFVPQTRRQDEK